jgi:predicted adenylyl cyclase CyaB
VSLRVGSREFEVKVSLEGVDLGRVSEALEGLGFRYLGEVYEEDHYVDLRSCSSYRYGTVLRFRRSETPSGTEFRLTYKGVVESSRVKAREEVEIPLPDGRLLEVFRKLGFQTIRVAKRRRVYARGELRVFLDVVEGLGSFAEFEMVNPESEEVLLREVRAVLRDLGLEGRPLIVESYLELLLRSAQRG